jgi:hypothetical protein
MKSILKALGVVVVAGALPACGSGNSDDFEDVDLSPLFAGFNPYGGYRSEGPVAEIQGVVPTGEAVVEVRWFNDTTGAQGLAEGTSSWTARVPVVPGANAVTVTARDAAGRLASTTRRVVYDDLGVRFAGSE